jgi:branched-chain amino acid transport system permease protein
MELLLQLAKNGVIIGLLYGLFAYGMSLIIATSGVLHFAHGLTLAGSAYSFWFFLQDQDLGVFVAILGALAVGGLLGILVELGIYRPLRRIQATDMVFLVASLSVLTLGQAALIFIFGTDPKAVVPTAFLRWSTDVGPFNVRMWDLLIIGASALAFTALYLLQRHTSVGLSFRAVGDNPHRAQTLGIKLQRTYVWVFLAGSLVAVLPGMLLAVQNPVTPSMGFDLLIKAVIALVVGGIGSMPGALLGGVLIGVVESVAVYWLPTEWSEFTLYALLFVFVIARPQGLTKGALRTA